MLLNADKTNFINFDSKGHSFDNALTFHSLYCLLINNCQCPIIKQMPHIKCLGTINILDEHISWKQHIY